MAEEHDSCAVAHGTAPASSVRAGSAGSAARVLVAVFASPVSAFLLRYAADTGFHGLLVEPVEDRAAGAAMSGFQVLRQVPEDIEGADVVVTDHHRDELGAMLRDALATKARWIGVIGNPRVPAPHIPALQALGVPPGEIARVHRPIGLNIGSRIPPEIAISTLAGLIADHNGRPGGFEFQQQQQRLGVSSRGSGGEGHSADFCCQASSSAASPNNVSRGSRARTRP